MFNIKREYTESYNYIRIYDDFFNRREIKRIKQMEKSEMYMYVYFYASALAAQHGGLLLLDEHTAHDAITLSAEIAIFTPSKIVEALEVLKRYKLISEHDNLVLEITDLKYETGVSNKRADNQRKRDRQTKTPRKTKKDIMFYYYRLDENFMHDERIQQLLNMDEGYIYVNTLILIYALASKFDGHLKFDESHYYDYEDIALDMNLTPLSAEIIIDTLVDLGLTSKLENGGFYVEGLINWSGARGASAKREQKLKIMEKVETRTEEQLNNFTSHNLVSL